MGTTPGGSRLPLLERLLDAAGRFFHDVLEWHDGDGSNVTFDGCSLVSRCKRCGKQVLQDSNGDWF